MTTAELIAALEALPPDLPVQVTFGGCAVRPLAADVRPVTRQDPWPIVRIHAEGWYR